MPFLVRAQGVPACPGADNDFMGIFARKKYTAAVVGLGRIGFSLGMDAKREQPASHTMALMANRSIEIIAGADCDVHRADEWKSFMESKRRAPAVFYSTKELYGSVHPDIVVVAVNEASHLGECLDAIQSRPSLVILEKPVALDTAEAMKIRAATSEFSVPVMVNHERRFSADYIAARDFLPRIGEIQRVRAELDSGLRVYAPQFEKDGSYSLIHDGTHLVDIVRFLLGVELSSPRVTGIFRDKDGIVRNFTAHYATSRIPDIEISMSGRSKFFSFGIDILGTLGRICIGNGYAKFYERRESKLYTGFYSLSNAKIRVPKKTGYFSNMVQNAVDFLSARAPLVSPLDEAIADLRVLEEIKEQLK